MTLVSGQLVEVRLTIAGDGWRKQALYIGPLAGDATRHWVELTGKDPERLVVRSEQVGLLDGHQALGPGLFQEPLPL